MAEQALRPRRAGFGTVAAPLRPTPGLLPGLSTAGNLPP